jgi:hypothetical protein
MRKERKNSNKFENDENQGKTNLIMELHLKEKPFRRDNVTVIIKNLLQLRTRELKQKPDLAENRCVRKTREYMQSHQKLRTKMPSPTKMRMARCASKRENFSRDTVMLRRAHGQLKSPDIVIEFLKRESSPALDAIDLNENRYNKSLGRITFTSMLEAMHTPWLRSANFKRFPI